MRHPWPRGHIASRITSRRWTRYEKVQGPLYDNLGSIHNDNNDQTKMAATVRRETSWRRRWKPDLNSQPWKPFSISGKSFLVKSMFVEMDCSYEFCLWDSSTFWYEKVEHDNFKRRAKVSNNCKLLDFS